MTTIDISHSLSLNVLLGDPPDSVSSYHYSYHAGDSIQGSISIKSDVDLQFETLDIFLIGEESTTRHDRNPRQFHSVQYPIPTSELPSENIIQKHKQYFFRFAFPVPDTLPPEACQHPVITDSIRQIHLQAPPSFGDPDVAGFGGKLRNDYAPTNCRIVYTIQARLSRRSLATERLQLILQKNLKIRLKPDSAHALVPLSPTAHLQHPHKTIEIYQRLPKSKSKSKAKFKTGRLTTTIIAPPRFDVPVRETDASVRQAIRLNLHFEQDIQSDDNTHASTTDIREPTTFLPQIQSLHGSVVASTFFTKTYNTDIPVKAKDRLGTKLNYADKVLTEFTHSITSLQWAGEMDSGETTRTTTRTSSSTRASTSTSTSSDSSSAGVISENSQVDDPTTTTPTTNTEQRDSHPSSSVTVTGPMSRSFSSTLLVPVKLSHQFIIPTFHSCRVSRTYTLVLRLKVQGAPTIKIETPMFIAPAVELLRPPPYSFSEMQVVEGVEGEET